MTRAVLLIALLGLAACHKAPAPAGEAPAPQASAPATAAGGGELTPSTDENALPGDGMARAPDAPAPPAPATPAK